MFGSLRKQLTVTFTEVSGSLRKQLTVTFTALAAVVVIGSAGGMAVLVDRVVWGLLDAELIGEAESLAALRDASTADDLTQAVSYIGREPHSAQDKFIQVAEPNGRVIARWGQTLREAETHTVLYTFNIHRSTVKDVGHTYRIVRYGAPRGGWVQVGVRADRQVRTLRRAQIVITAIAAMLLVMLALLAWRITGHATAELGRLAAELETVEAGSLERRLVPRHTSEVDQLVTVLNRLLSRLESAIVRLRRFAADAAHELRTPVAALRAHVEVALARGDGIETYREGLLDTLEQTERLARLAEDLLTLSTVENEGSATTEPVRLGALVCEVAEFLEPVAYEQGREFTWNVPANGATVQGSCTLLKRLVLNLVDNAFRHTAPTAGVELLLGTGSDSATITVCDQGAGISTAEQALAFERFHRGAGSTGSAGLGLPICREIVVRHGGEITLRSTLGAGTTVTVVLPLMKPVSADESPTSR